MAGGPADRLNGPLDRGRVRRDQGADDSEPRGAAWWLGGQGGGLRDPPGDSLAVGCAYPRDSSTHLIEVGEHLFRQALEAQAVNVISVIAQNAGPAADARSGTQRQVEGQLLVDRERSRRGHRHTAAPDVDRRGRDRAADLAGQRARQRDVRAGLSPPFELTHRMIMALAAVQRKDGCAIGLSLASLDDGTVAHLPHGAPPVISRTRPALLLSCTQASVAESRRRTLEPDAAEAPRGSTE